MNPNKYACPSCNVVLTAGRQGKILQIVGAIIGAAIAAYAIFMGERGNWTTLETIVWFAIALPAVVLPYQWFCWRTYTFSRLTESGVVEAGRTSNLALMLALFCWLLFFVGAIWPYEPFKVYRFLGFLLGGMATIPTLALCAYYYFFRRVRTASLLAASIVSGVYLLVALSLIGLVATGNQMALKWL